MVKAIVFDCFGVIVGKGFDYTYRLAGGDPVKDKRFIYETLAKANLGLISDQAFRRLMAAKLGISNDKWRKAVRQAEQADRQLLDYIKSLRLKYKTAILSNANYGVLERKIGEQCLKDCFDQIIVSAEVGLVKPDPRIYEMAAERLGVSLNECVFVDDRQLFLDAGQNLGMKVILYQDFKSLRRDLAALTAA